MKLSALRPALIGWLTGRLGVETWYLEPPAFEGDVAGFVPPLRDLDMIPVDDQYDLQAVQEFMVGFRYETVSYQELPLADLEGIYATTLMAAYDFYSSLGITINPMRDSTAIVVQEYNDTGYLVYLCWTLGIHIKNIEPEEDLRGPRVQRILVNLFRRSLLGDSDSLVANLTSGTP